MDNAVEEVLLIVLVILVVILAAGNVTAAFFAWRAAIAARDASANSYLTMTDSAPPPVPRKRRSPYRVIGS